MPAPRMTRFFMVDDFASGVPEVGNSGSAHEPKSADVHADSAMARVTHGLRDLQRLRSIAGYATRLRRPGEWRGACEDRLVVVWPLDRVIPPGHARAPRLHLPAMIESSPSPRAFDESVEVVVIGGGPGGSTTAARLAQRGRKVIVLEPAIVFKQ